MATSFGDELTSRPRRRDDQGDALTSHRWGGGGGDIFPAFYAISNISRNKNSGNTKIIQKYFRKSILFHLMFSLWFFPSIFIYIFGNIEKCPFTFQIVDIGNFNMKLNAGWFPQIVERDSGNLYVTIRRLV